MIKNTVKAITLALAIVTPLSANAADWESVKEKVCTWRKDMVVYSQESWKSTEGWRQETKQDMANLMDRAKGKSKTWLESGQKAFTDFRNKNADKTSE